MKPLLPIVFLFLMTHPVFAQTFDSLSMNNIGANILAGGKVFGSEDGGKDGIYYPLSENVKNNTVYAGGYWLGGVDMGGLLHVAAQTYNQSGFDYWTGPVATNYDADYDNRYNRVWSITRQEINNHTLNYNSEGYIMPEVIANWPVHGNVANGEPYYLAPFTDVNNDGVYHPDQGDYPIINGDKAVYFIINDARLPHTETGGNPFGIDIYSMVYAYNAPDIPFLHNSIFLNTRIVNRSEQTYNMLFGMWMDFDMGNLYNDATGCDTLLNMYYGYNRDTISEEMMENGLPAQGCMMLNHHLNSCLVSKNDFSVQGNPNTPDEYYRYLNGLWKNGAPLTYGGNGMGGDIATHYMFSGNPLSGEGWTMLNADPPFSPPTDLRVQGSINPFSLSPNEQICIDMAFPAAQAPSGTPMPHIAAVAQLKEYAQEIQDWYDTSFGNCAIDLLATGVHDFTANQPEMQVHIRYDMASQNVVFDISSPYQEQVNLQLINMEGKIAQNYQAVLQKGSNTLSFSFTGLPQGMYIASVSSTRNSWRGKIIVPF